ncbi:MAG: Na(+)-translocating NADH-quinone reductase subunit A [Gammaproteobacteria bacterium]|nr:Na(+)-translocating NADH-quinone reductase subunit A [Gammaproteobacteria bacterium]NIN62331.1 Na(+)-translocating NADH-quinone reductase subunit A [Gammaproteobacteria bacterium]NIO62340.1 Na(+)-translocating NADH-quinone reductase subunit A [Gammaproteobacteria bacterium]NIP49635.1 Na(+)-translocating NADH-quinone reductase subunit A [Gammaproteobacteria bacterium]NIQ10860.1 Na(+)-translocating NADH-quinone reductase subunit A [Gammaproteobacteria bacterium]
MIRIKKGLDLPINGKPKQVIHAAMKPISVAFVAKDYNGIKPKVLVNEGERVKLGQALIADKHTQVRYTSPASGIVSHVQWGSKRILQSIVVRVDGHEEETFPSSSRLALDKLSSEKVKNNLLASGLWTAFRTRPFSKNPSPGTTPHSIFVTAIDTNPLAADPAVIINEYRHDFVDGLTILSRLADVPVFICKAPLTEIPAVINGQIRVVEFEGPHPAGLVGTHIHYLDPVGAEKTIWHLDYQNVIAIGKLFTSGRLWVERIISLAGPQVLHPRLLRVRLGTEVQQLLKGELMSGKNRVLSGSVLSGRQAEGTADFLGRYHNQISVVKEDDEREFLGWLGLGRKKFSVNDLFMSHFSRNHKFDFTTSLNGSRRAIFPLDNFERVLPLDVLPVPLLKSLLIMDIETAEALGCLELDEEDLALCTYVCCSKQEYGSALRSCLTKIEAGR